jgi:membrane protein DedA with SNARE-associated domain
MFTGYETPGVCAAKAWDSPRSGTVPVLLISALTLAPFWTATFILLGYFMGKDWHRVSEMLHRHLRLGSGIVTLAIIVWFLVRWLQGKYPMKQPVSEG